MKNRIRKTIVIVWSILAASTATKAQQDFLAIRSNLLVPLTNIGIEVPIIGNALYTADIYYPWFPSINQEKECFQLLAFKSGLLFRISEHPFKERRQMAGFSFFTGYYDMERRWSGKQGEFFGINMEYSYHIGCVDGMLLEFSAGLGILGNRWRAYDVYSPGGSLIKRSGPASDCFTTWIGPTGVAINLAIPFRR